MAEISKNEWYELLLSRGISKEEAQRVTNYDPLRHQAEVIQLRNEDEQARIQRVNDSAWNKMKDWIGLNGRGRFCS